MIHKRKIKIILLCIFTLVFNLDKNCKIAFADEISELYSLSATIIDGENGRVLYEKNGYEIRAMASTTKIMTLIVALENGDKDSYVTVSSYASKMPDVQLGICEGEQYRLEDLYYSLMLESHNDVAVAIAEHIGGSVSSFADMMNNKARDLGLNSTYFITPNGLDASDENGKHSTTAVDLARIMKYCVLDSPTKKEFINICQTKSYSFTDASNKRSFTVNNKNAFLDMMDGVIAGKTGFTGDAGYCYVCALENDGRTFIIALLGCGWPNNKKYKWHDSKKLFTYGINNYIKKSILDEKYELPCVKVLNGINADSIVPYISANEKMLLSDSDDVKIDVVLPRIREAPVGKGEIIGKIDIYINGELYKTQNIYSDKTVRRVTYGFYLKKVISMFCIG